MANSCKPNERGQKLATIFVYITVYVLSCYFALNQTESC